MGLSHDEVQKIAALVDRIDTPIDCIALMLFNLVQPLPEEAQENIYERVCEAWASISEGEQRVCLANAFRILLTHPQ